LLGKIFLSPSHNQNTLIQADVKGIVFRKPNSNIPLSLSPSSSPMRATPLITPAGKGTNQDVPPFAPALPADAFKTMKVKP
jgi:hypothetical protein